MTEQLERITEDGDALTAHILSDLHELRMALAEVCAVLSKVDQRTAALEPMLPALARLVPAAERAAALLDTPAAAWVAGRRKEGSTTDDRPGKRGRDGKRARVVRRPS